jgi:ribosome-associated heat shock protein Hsp15
MAGRDPQTGPGAPAGERQRLDKWLWFARVVKTRALAAKLVTAGHVRLNGAHAAGPDKPVRPGDVLTIALERQVRVLRVVAPGERRGPYEEARRLYDDLTAPADSPPADSSPDPGR